jgi:hypothetical protein
LTGRHAQVSANRCDCARLRACLLLKLLWARGSPRSDELMILPGKSRLLIFNSGYGTWFLGFFAEFCCIFRSF